MATFQISNKVSGADLGTFEGETETQAFVAMCVEQGYAVEFDSDVDEAVFADDETERLCDRDSLSIVEVVSDWQQVDGEIQALDLRRELDEAQAQGLKAESTRFRVIGADGYATGSVYDAIFVDGRAGVATGADADWTDASSLDDGIRRVLSGDIVN